MGAPEIRWLSVFADVPADRFDAAVAFWTAAAETEPGEPDGDHGEFVPLRPADGDAWLWLQRVGCDTPGWHLDLHVAEPEAAAEHAWHLGATLERHNGDLAVLHTPAGQPFCFVLEEAEQRRRAEPPRWPSGRSLADQLCLDIPADRFAAESEFWSELTGWPRLTRHTSPEFGRIGVPERLPVQFLLQRLGPDDDTGSRAHLDLSADDRDAEVARHVALGAQVIRRTDGWTTLCDPAGLVYCVTGRATGIRFT